MAEDRHIAAGNDALQAGRWWEARAAFEAALEERETADALMGLGQVLWWLETARVRLDLARVLAEEHPEVAVGEARSALTTFARLGARAHADSAGALLRSLGEVGRVGPRNVDVLTQREQEVLRLIGLGLTNPEIARRLFISRKTVGHHAGRVLAKLGLRNRAEAIAYATRTWGDLKVG